MAAFGNSWQDRLTLFAFFVWGRFVSVRRRTKPQTVRGHMRQLLDFQTVQARRIEPDGSITLVPAQSLLSKHMALMLAGDLVPADGHVCSGVAAVDQRHITGESVPATRKTGDMVFAESSIVEGSITVSITEAGADTAVAKIVQLIESAPVGETRIQNYAEQFADRLVAPLLGANVALLALTGNVDRFMSMAIIDYGTGIRVCMRHDALLAQCWRVGGVSRASVHIGGGHLVVSGTGHDLGRQPGQGAWVACGAINAKDLLLEPS